MKRKFWLSLALASVMVITAACGANTGSTGNTGNTGSNVSTNEGNEANTGGDPEKVYKIAISQVVEHASLDATRQGFIDALKDAGIEEGKNLEIDFNNAQGDATNFKTISQKIATGDSDLALGIATPTAQTLVDDVTDRPVLFAAVTDPVDAGIVPQLAAPGGNVTGAADTNPDAIIQTMDFIAAHFPDVKAVGLVINEGETNAVIMANIAEEALAKHGIELVKAPVATSSDVKQAIDSLVGRVQALYITLDNMVVSGADAIIEVANENDIPFFSADRDTVEKGAFATVGFKYYDHGYEVGQMAVEILKNGKNPGEMDVTVPQKLDFIINMKAAAEQGVTVTDEMKSMVKDPGNNIIE
ncbi:ABC transporter substrate-binding protein [Paenibacillus sp. sgz302251]|uniref:ABC transporter substrate-binding protein n=1 Tax=Paenibacillus sp. sgz302251 TaxID=3414493 RepID=UPI003C7A7C9D